MRRKLGLQTEGVECVWIQTQWSTDPLLIQTVWTFQTLQIARQWDLLKTVRTGLGKNFVWTKVWVKEKLYSHWFFFKDKIVVKNLS